jgi:hypothetical protein
MLQAFIDESESERTPPAFIMGGYIAKAETWADFSTAWDEALKAKPSIRYFKLRDAARGNNQFYGWSDVARTERIALMRGIIERFDLRAFSLGFYLADLRETHAAFHSKWSNPYYNATLALIPQLARCIEDFKLPREPLEIIFDDRVMEKGTILQAYDDARAIAKPKPPDLFTAVLRNPPRWANDEDTLPLQAADMQATWKRMKVEAKHQGKPMPSLPGFKKSLLQVEFWADRPYFEHQAAHIMKMVQSAIAADGASSSGGSS